MRYLNQEFFDPLDYGSRELAKERKAQRAKELKTMGYIIKSSVLKNQLRPYAGLGMVDGRIRDVFMISVFED